MEMDPQERESEIGEESPVSHNEEDIISEGEGSPRDHEDQDSCDDMRRHSMMNDHVDVLAKLKMQVRDIKDDFENGPRTLNYPRGLSGGGGGGGTGGGPDTFQLPVPFPFPHPAAAFLPPMAPQAAAPSSGSSHSSEGSASSQHTWSFEEQFKQVRQLYEINDDPKRKEFLDDLFSFMQKRGTPINRLPIMAKSVLDLYELYNLVIARGGLVDVINKKLWQEIIKGLHLPSSITSAAFTLRTQYMKYLYPYECEKRRLSTPAELQAAIDGNRREGRRSSYGQYDSMQRSPNATHQISSPLSLISHQQQLAARMNSMIVAGGMNLHNGVHHPTHPQPMTQPLNGGPVSSLAPGEFESRMMEYMKLLNKEIRSTAATPPRQDMSPPNAPPSPINHLEFSRINLWNIYNNNQQVTEPQKVPLNLSEPTPMIKREPEHRESPPPGKKRMFTKEDEEPEEEPEIEHPPTPKSLSPTTHIKINSRGDSRNGDNSLVVSMELNGVTYQGVLFAQNASNTRTPVRS
ncbi:protein dead ringer isoform X2 [Aethina tumida]|uniref:protein dead ringer isoform X2 n=1 Tax=Aethina tumida TaxID=116153 RepID=UPI00096AF496|nr:protein dead ringer isoform X2 [Aethina tumida]